MGDTKNMTDDFYNDFRNASEYYQRTINYDMTNIYKPFMEHINTGEHILDAGCGPGRDSLYFLNNGYKVTAFDASEEMVKIASKLTNQNVVKMRFQDMNFVNVFDGIWANASLLHVSKTEMKEVFNRLSNALRNSGVMFISFKHGNKEENINGRFFNFYNEESWSEVIKNFSGIKTIKIWKEKDEREGHKNEYWLYILLRKEENR